MHAIIEVLNIFVIITNSCSNRNSLFSSLLQETKISSTTLCKTSHKSALSPTALLTSSRSF